MNLACFYTFWNKRKLWYNEIKNFFDTSFNENIFIESVFFFGTSMKYIFIKI